MRRLVTFPSRSACRFVTAVTLFATVFGGAFSGRVAAQGPRFLAKEDIILLGLGLTVQPAKQTVPKNIATIVSTFLQSPNQVGNLPPFAPDAEVHATLNGPAFSSPQELVTKPNSPLNIPPLPVAGTYTVESIRLVSGGQVLLYGSPEAVEIDVIDKLLVTQVTARALTADEIRAAGIVFDKSSFQAYNFTAAFAVSDGPQIQIDFPVVLPTLKSPQDLSVSTVDLTTITPPALKSLSTIVPDTLKIQTQIPNLSVTGFSLQITDVASQDFFVPPIAGVIVIPGDIAFLNQFFNITLMVGNAAPTGSGLVVSNLTAAISLPAGPSGVVGADDAPLRMATTANGPSPGTQPVAQPGPDGKLGTADDITTLAPGETGQSQFLVEGRREGTFTITMDLEGTLNGLPVGPVPISGRAAGAVVVRNPKFTLTFTHPDVVNAGEPYTLDVTVTNTSDSPANFVSIDLNAQNISGATLAGPSSQSFDTIAPSDSQTGHFDLVSNLTGNVTAATLDSDSNIAGHFQLKTAVGELGVPLSPDELILPQQASSLPQSLRDAALGLLARAWAVAVAPPAAVPSNLQRFSKQVVLDHAVDVAEAGFRYSLGEALPDSASQLLFDFMGSAYPRLNERVTTPDNLPFAQQDYQGFDLLRRLSVRGDVFGNAVGSLIADALARAGAAPFHLALAEKLAYRPPHISVLVTDASGRASPVNLVVLDSSGNQVGGGTAQKITKGIPYSDYMNINNAGGAITAQFAFIAVPQPGQFTVQLQRLASAPANEPYTVSVVFPGSDGLLHHAAFSSLGPNDIPTLSQPSTDPYQLTFQILSGGATITGNPVTATLATVPDPPPTVLGAVQMANADTVGCPAGVQYQAGRIVAVLFSKEVTPASVQDQAKPSDITNFLPEASRAVGVALQPG
ncbi:MAG TPA: hypothetical protein VNZ26_13075, partial [Vicinamibacterales bacterium]|nr:hypothetical protein [Vicinamibacterales bacterium]